MIKRGGFFVVVVSALGLASLFLSGCATGYCREIKKENIKAQNGSAVKKKEGPVDNDNFPESKVKGEKEKKDARTLVYRYDGSLQCAMGRVETPEQMEAQLKGVQVFSRQKRSDGLMHIQVCGQPTGSANVYEILEKDLKVAEARGFKKWDFE